MVRSTQRGGWAWLLFFGPAIIACHHAVEPCRAVAQCDAEYECLANRCVLKGGAPLPRGLTRRIVLPTALAVLDGDGRAFEALPPRVTFGRERGADERLLLLLDPVWESMDVEAAFLLLTPTPDAPAALLDTLVRVHEIRDAWTHRSLTESTPSLSATSVTALGRSNAPGPLRLDVTALLRDSDHVRHGLALVADTSTDVGATYSTGSADGAAPFLEIYDRDPAGARAVTTTTTDEGIGGRGSIP